MPPRSKKPGRGGARNSPYAKGRTDSAIRAREQFLECISNGLTVNESLKAVDRSPNWYTITRAKHPEWATRITEARLTRDDPTLNGIDFVRFRHLYFGFDTAEHHYKIVEAIDGTKPGELTVVLGFPGLGKTQTLTDWYSFALANDPNLRIGVVSEGQGLSRDIVSQVADRMTDTERFSMYHAKYGPFKARAWEDSERDERDPRKRPWTADYFKILASDADQKDPSLASFGATGRVYGKRFDVLILDDIQSNETLANTDKYLRSFRTSWSSRINLGGGRLGKMIAIGSRVGPGDFYEKLAEEGLIDTLVTIPALTQHVPRDEHFTVNHRGEIEINPDCPASPTWPQMSLMQLAQLRKKAGEEVWARTYMQDIVADTTSVFTDEMLEGAKDWNRALGPSAVGTDVWGSVDPALDSGQCAFMLTAVDSDRLHVLDSATFADISTYADIYHHVGKYQMRYRASLWIVEENNFQKGMLGDERLHRAARPADVIAHRTNRNKNDNIMGVRRMASAFIDGEIRIPWGNAETRERMTPLIEELRRWRPNVRGAHLQQDRVMTLWFAWLRWQVEREAMGGVVHLLPRPSWVRGVA